MKHFNPIKKGILLFYLSYWLFTFCSTQDYVNWVVENLLVFLFAGFFLWQKKSFESLSTFSFACVFLFVLQHISGSQYAYTHHPLGLWLKNLLHTERNMYDRIVHFNFGLLIVLPLKEFLGMRTDLSDSWCSRVAFLLICTLAGVFELLEWIIGGLLFPETGTDYVGTQGDIWDAQKDMAVAMVAAGLVLIVYRYFMRSKSMKVSSS